MHLGVFWPADDYENGPAGADTYARLLEDAVWAEDVGLESFWVAEHHFSNYGVVPDPAPILAAAAARTAHLRLGTATAVLPLRHPLHVAETYALLDQLCGGRLDFGAGSGYLPHEFAAFDIDLEQRRGLFDEALDVLRLAWSGRPVRYRGRLQQLEAPPLNVRPCQPGGPPIHVAVVRAASAPFVARRGLHLLHIPYIALDAETQLAALVRSYRRELPQGVRGQVTVALHAFCAETPWRGPQDPAYREAEAALDLYLRTRVVPGARYDGRPIARDFVLFGDAEQLRPRLRALSAMGIDRLLLLAAFGGLPAPTVRASLARLAALAPDGPAAPVP
jgi:alkanesulfonate monooxygenase SsuD/methylene tetrahydromethanopterin reductase-like flavin-dependent oxidoreductase (luciferase family)